MLKERNHREVTLYRKSHFMMEAQLKNAPDFVRSSKQSIGSFWVNSNSKMVGSGLTFDEQKLLMPLIIDCEPSDRNFRTKVSAYFSNMRTVIPYDTGLTLQIGLTEDNNAPLSESNMPYDVHQYITWRHAAAHPQVAASKTAAEGNMLALYYIFDPQATEDSKVLLNENTDKAMELYLEVKRQPEKLDMLLTLLGISPRNIKYDGKNGLSLKIADLKAIAEKDPARFITVYETKNFAETYVLLTAVELGLITKVGAYFVDKNSQETIGHNQAEAIQWLKDKTKSDKVVLLKQRMQEAMKGQNVDAIIKSATGLYEEPKAKIEPAISEPAKDLAPGTLETSEETSEETWVAPTSTKVGAPASVLPKVPEKK